MTLKGRHWVMFWLLVGLGVTGAISARQTRASITSRALRVARDERSALEARRGELERRIRQASSRQVLVPRASASLGLHEPSASEMTVLVIPPDVSGGLPAEVLAAPTPARDTVVRAPARARAAPRTTTRRPPARRAPTRSTTRRP